jgi:hypothetical protein
VKIVKQDYHIDAVDPASASSCAQRRRSQDGKMFHAAL